MPRQGCLRPRVFVQKFKWIAEIRSENHGQGTDSGEGVVDHRRGDLYSFEDESPQHHKLFRILRRLTLPLYCDGTCRRST